MASLGAFEHFCSPEDHRDGRQDELYRGLFARIGSMLPDKGRFFLQTMVFGRGMIPTERIDIRAPRGSDAWYLALLGGQFPGSWLPHGHEQIIRSAEAHFRLVSSLSGRLDYIETIRQWRKRFAAPSLKKALLKLQLLPRWLTPPISGSRSPRASAPTASARAGAAGPLLARVQEEAFAVWLTDGVASGRFGPGALVRIGDGYRGSGPRAPTRLRDMTGGR